MGQINLIKTSCRNLKSLFFRIIFCLLSLFRRLCRRNVSKAYLILKHDGLGDLVLWTPYSLKLKEHIHRQNGTMILAVANFNVEIARHLHLADIVISIPVYQGSSLKYLRDRLKFYYLCGTAKFEKIAQATLSNAAVAGYLIDPLTAGEKLSLRDPTNKESGLERFFDHLVDTGDETIHGRYQLFFKALTGVECGSLSPVCVEELSEIAGSSQNEEDYITVCIGGSLPQKRWPWRYWSELLREICHIFQGSVLIIGDSSQGEGAEKIIASLPQYTRIINCCGTYRAVQLYPLLRNAKFNVSMDTGPAHIAAAVGGTVFVICGNGDRGIFFPYPREYGEGENVFSIFPPELGCSRCRNLDAECLQLPTFRCISEVSPGQVFNAVNEFLRSRKEC